MIHCAGCGYPLEHHQLGTEKCPVGVNEYARTAKFRPPPPIDPALYPEILRREALARQRAIEDARKPYEPEVIPPPLVPARAPRDASEYATSNRGISAAKLGRRATALGWRVEAIYWKAWDGSEGCALRLTKEPMRAVALWSRPAEQAGNLTGWKAEYAYGWRSDITDRFPTKLTLTDLERLIQ